MGLLYGPPFGVSTLDYIVRESSINSFISPAVGYCFYLIFMRDDTDQVQPFVARGRGGAFHNDSTSNIAES
jgi:hypothetical protein